MAKYYFASKERRAFRQRVERFGVRELTPYQYRVGEAVDFYPTTGKVVYLREKLTAIYVPGKEAKLCERYFSKTQSNAQKPHSKACDCPVCTPLELPDGYVPRPVILRPPAPRRVWVPPPKWTAKDIAEWNEERLPL